MYYLRTKSAVDAIKFTLNNDKKAEPEVEAIAAPKAKPVAVPVEATAVELSEFQAMIERSRAAEPDDCEMCGS